MKELSRKIFLLIFGIMLLVLLVSVIFLNVQSYDREYESIRRSLNIMDDRGNRFIPDKKPENKPENKSGDESSTQMGVEPEDDLAKPEEGDLTKPEGEDDLAKPEREEDLVKPEEEEDLAKPEEEDDLAKPEREEDLAKPEEGDLTKPEGGDLTMTEEGDDQESFENMMIMDQDVYTVEVSDGNVVRVLKHGNETHDFDASQAAEEIMESYAQDTLRIDNLYSSDYAFNYRGNHIVIVNTKDTREKLNKLLLITSGVFLVMVGVIYLLSKVITGWITKPAREAFDKQREFIADASHELKTPLAVIMASSDEMKADEENSKYIENIKFESDRMNRLIAGMLDLSKLEDGVTRTEQKEENLSKIVEKAALVFEGMAFENGVMLDTDIQDEITKKCCKEEMEKLVSTLIDNAIKHSYKDTSIQVSLKSIKNKVVLKVINTGDAIKEGEEEKIFERFYRSDKSRSRSENRYGLGLAIAKSIVQNHNGTIKAKSEGGKTTFTVEF